MQPTLIRCFPVGAITKCIKSGIFAYDNACIGIRKKIIRCKRPSSIEQCCFYIPSRFYFMGKTCFWIDVVFSIEKDREINEAWNQEKRWLMILTTNIIKSETRPRPASDKCHHYYRHRKDINFSEMRNAFSKFRQGFPRSLLDKWSNCGKYDSPFERHAK